MCSDGAVCAPRRSAGQLLIAVEMRGQPNVQLRPVTGTLIHPMPCAHPAVGRGPVRSGRYRPLAGCPTAPGVAYPCGPRPETGDRAPGPYTLRKYGAGGGDLAQPRLGLGSIRAAICSRTASPQRGWGGGSGHRYGLSEPEAPQASAESNAKLGARKRRLSTRFVDRIGSSFALPQEVTVRAGVRSCAA